MAGTSDSTTESGPYYDIFSLPRNGEAGGVASGTEAYYSFDYGNIHFVCLNSETDPSPDGAMMTWLEADLAANDKEWIIAFWHRPPYSRGSANSDTDSRQIALRQNAVPLLERYGVDLVLTGHTHAYERSYLIDGHYGLSDTFTDALKKNSGDGSATGDGAYQKPATVGAPHAGAVYVVAGNAGVIKTGGSLDHPAMAVSIRTLGSMVLDVNGSRLDAMFLDSTGTIRDDFTILKLSEAPNTAPSFTPGTAAFTVAENQTAAGTVQAADGDSADEVTGYAFEGALEDGADQSHFSLGSTSGVLTFQTPPNFEAPQDADTNNTYVVVVRATSGTGTRLKTADQTVTVTVTDVNTEAPGVPSALTFSGETRDSLTVRWTEPENTGPPITDYDVQYHTGSDAYREWTHEGPGRTATITGLDLGTAYEVQVRASNEEGRSDWSEPGEGTTIAPLRVQMTLDPEPPVEGAFKARFSFSETVTGFTLGDIATQQDADCRNENNDQVACNPPLTTINGPNFEPLQTTDNQVFTTTVTPQTEGVNHNYTLTITVAANTVSSVADSKPNEAATLQVRIAPPGVTVPISSLGLTASPGNAQVTLRWNVPENTGGSAIIRYEYRWAESGGEFSAWVSVAPAERSATVRELTNGREYMFEVRPVNALGYGLVTTARAAARSGGGGPPGGGGPRQTVPGAPINLVADATDGAVTLTWEAPENDGGSEITDYEYRIDRRNPWISIGSTDTAHTVTGLVNGTEYVFEVRAVNRIGKSFSSNRAEATPEAPEVFTLDFAHFANGTGITSEMVLVNVAPHPIRPAIYFYDRGGHLIDPESVLEVTADLEIQEDGGLTVQTEMDPLAVLTISTHGQGELVSGSVKVVSEGLPIGGGLRYNLPAIGEAVVGAGPPVGDALFPVRRQEGGINTGVAIHNLGEEAMEARCELMREGVLRDFVSISLEANGQTSWLIDQAFPAADTSDFTGSVRCAAPGRGRFTAIAVEMDAARRIFISVVPLDRTGGGNKQTTLDFAHFVNGTWITDLVFVNLSTEASRPAPTPFHTDIPLFISTTPRATRLPPNRWWTSRAIWRSPRTAL